MTMGLRKICFQGFSRAPGFIIQIGLRAENKDIIQNYSMCDNKLSIRYIPCIHENSKDWRFKIDFIFKNK
jgi:hypothetical protein